MQVHALRCSVAILLERGYICKAVLTKDLSPRCPQVPYDLTPLFRIARDTWAEPENELECLNLSVTLPSTGATVSDHLPVLVWIHGGSFVAAVPSVASGIADPSHLVAASIQSDQPIVVVNINYRLGFFGFGYTGSGRANLGLFDQRTALEWVSRHIAGFGGDSERITLAGESAGAISVHAHCQAGGKTLFQRAVLMSGSMYTVPAQPVEVSHLLTLRVAEHLGLENPHDPEKLLQDLRSVPAAGLVKAQEELCLHALWSTDDGSFFAAEWDHEKVPEGGVEALLVGDCEWESNLWNRAISKLSTTELVALFPETETGQKIRSAYGIHERMTVGQARKRTLDFIGDAKFNFPVEMISNRWRKNAKAVFRYVMDEPNPFEPAAGSHHTVDLLFLFGAHDNNVAQAMKSVWIKFVNGQDCWEGDGIMAFGPAGEAKVHGPDALNGRRRTTEFAVLQELGWDGIKPVVAKVVVGKINFDPGF